MILGQLDYRQILLAEVVEEDVEPFCYNLFIAPTLLRHDAEANFDPV